MVPIKQIIYQSGVDHIYKLVVPSGNFAGEYVINQPSGWEEVDSVININEDRFNVEDFIIGGTVKLLFSEFSNKTAFDLLKNVYNEQGGDARVIFKWFVEFEGVLYDILSDNFEINFNKRKEGFEQTMMALEYELIKSESENKLYAREETTVDLFSDKDLDENTITPVTTFNIGYKKGNKILTNFYTYDFSQDRLGAIAYDRTGQFFSFQRSDNYEFGNNSNNYASYQNYGPGIRTYQGPFASTDITLKLLKVEITELSIEIRRGDHTAPNATLYAVIRNGDTFVRREKIKDAEPLPVTGGTDGIITIDSGIWDLGTLQKDQNITFEIQSNEGVNIAAVPRKTSTTIKLTVNMESPLVKTKGVRLIEALNQIAKNYTSGEIMAESFILGPGGSFYNTSISTGMYLRGLPDDFLTQKIKTSMKDLFHEGCSKLLALGYDVINDKMIVEDIAYFFKDYKVYDLSEKQYFNEDFSIDHDDNLSYNLLQFGSKKYSTEIKFDIRNFNTTAEISTPIKKNKSKFDMQTDLIIDEFKIQELVEDKSSSTNENDDDKVLIDMVEAINHWDSGVFENCQHSDDGGKLLLNCTQTPFDTTLIQIGSYIEITEGINQGQWQVISIDGTRMKVNKSTGIETGAGDTPIRYLIPSLIKNRTNEGFFVYGETIFNPQTTTNIRHNPKYQMARWWPYFGSGLRKKLDSENLKVTSYKNNSEAKVKIIGSDMTNELPGDVIVGGNEPLSRMRNFQRTFFNGEKIQISYNRVTWEEFFMLYVNWRYGEDNDRTKSRGYIPCNTPYGIYDVYPFGQEAFKHNKSTNELTIRGKIKGKSVDNPVLLSVVQENRNTLTLTWDYLMEYVNPLIKIQYSLDGANWETVHTVTNVKTATFSNDIFNSILTGTNVYFRIVINTADYYNKVSNTRLVTWQFNDWILREISRTENTNCGYSYLTLEVTGTVDLVIKWNYEDDPGGGNYIATDLVANTTIASFDSPYGSGNADEQILPLNLSGETKTIYIQLKNSDKTASGTPLNCNSGNMLYTVDSSLNIEFKDLATDETTSFFLRSRIFKRYIDLPLDPDPGTP